MWVKKTLPLGGGTRVFFCVGGKRRCTLKKVGVEAGGNPELKLGSMSWGIECVLRILMNTDKQGAMTENRFGRNRLTERDERILGENERRLERVFKGIGGWRVKKG